MNSFAGIPISMVLPLAMAGHDIRATLNKSSIPRMPDTGRNPRESDLIGIPGISSIAESYVKIDQIGQGR